MYRMFLILLVICYIEESSSEGILGFASFESKNKVWININENISKDFLISYYAQKDQSDMFSFYYQKFNLGYKLHKKFTINGIIEQTSRQSFGIGIEYKIWQ